MIPIRLRMFQPLYKPRRFAWVGWLLSACWVSATNPISAAEGTVSGEAVIRAPAGDYLPRFSQSASDVPDFLGRLTEFNASTVRLSKTTVVASLSRMVDAALRG